MLTKRDLNDYDLSALLAWYAENGIDGAWHDEPQNRLKPSAPINFDITQEAVKPVAKQVVKQAIESISPPITSPVSSGVPLKDALDAVKTVKTLADLKQAIIDYPHLSIKSTASQIVFGDGNEQSELMIIGDAPNADDDRSGTAFAGEVGELLNKMMGAIGRTRGGDTPQNSFYVTNILKWRPPGNRTPTQFEWDVSMPFIKKQIELIKPRAIVLMGGAATKLLLGRNDTITKLRGKFQIYEAADGTSIDALPSFHPSYLLKSPTQKKASWDDLQALRDRLAG